VELVAERDELGAHRESVVAQSVIEGHAAS